MRLIVLTVVMVASIFCMKAQSPFTDIRSLALAQCKASVAGVLNPAANSLDKRSDVGFSYLDRYGIKEMASKSLYYQQPLNWIDFALLADYFGYDLYNQINCGLNVGKLLTRDISLGLRFCFFRMDYVDAQKSINEFPVDIGLQYRLVDNLRFGCLLRNAFRASYKVGDQQYDLPVALSCGFNVRLVSALLTIIEMEKNSLEEFCFRLAMEYTVFENFNVRGGMQTSPLVPTYGIGYLWRNIGFDVGGIWHPELGLSTGLSLSYNF